LRVGKFAGALPDNGGQRTPRYQQVDQIAAEGISSTAQSVQLDPIGSLGLLESYHRPSGDAQLRGESRCAHAEGFADGADPAFLRASQTPERLPLIEVAIK
jgi:hypothetical protein